MFDRVLEVIARRRPRSPMWMAMPARVTTNADGSVVIDASSRAERRRVARKVVKGYEMRQTHTGITKNQGKRYYGPGGREIGRYLGKALS